MLLFLSYSHEDTDVAMMLARRLREEQYDVFFFQDPKVQGNQFIRMIESKLTAADGFLALASPSYFRSGWCEQERNLAMQRENDLRQRDSAARFIYVVQARVVPLQETGFLRNYAWINLAAAGGLDAVVDALDATYRPNGRPTPPAAPVPAGAQGFRNRQDELEKLLRGVNNASGPHFLLIVATPALGKSWLLGRVLRGLTDPQAIGLPIGEVRWTGRLVDLRHAPPATRADAGLLLSQLLPGGGRVGGDPDLLAMAQAVIRGDRPYVCVLDSVELLDRATAQRLRRYLSEIHRMVQDSGHRDVRLAVVLAGRGADGWQGVTPNPRLSVVLLTQFADVVVTQALTELADRTHRDKPSWEIRKHAQAIHRATEGLPALLVGYLDWVRREQWLRLERLDSQVVFEELAGEYIERGLLAADSLVPGGTADHAADVAVLRHALRVLVPYRLFTRSHLYHHLDHDPAFRAAVEGRGWRIGDLWAAVTRAALLSEPLHEPWQKLHAAVRRLLFRFHYRDAVARADAHREARKFVESWMDHQSGTEQAVGTVECLWHEASLLHLERPQELEVKLTAAARQLCGALRPSPAYTPAELRVSVARLIGDDDEFQQLLRGVPGLFQRLIDLVETVDDPPEGSP